MEPQLPTQWIRWFYRKVPATCACAYSNVRMYSEGLRAYALSIMG